MVGVNGTAEVPEHPLLEGLLGRPLDRVGGCQSPGVPHTPLSAPWRDTAREDDKTRLYEYVRDAPDGTPLSKVVRDVFEGGSGDYSNTDYQLARRFFERHDCFLITRRGGNLWVEPTPDLFHLNRCKQSVGTPDGAGVESKTPGDRDKWAKDRARATLSKVSRVGSDGLRADLLGELGTELDSIAERYTIHERVRGSGPEYLLVPYSTRFNSRERVEDTRARYHRAWDRATERYDKAVSVTLTTDPKMHDSIADATDALLKHKNDLGRWLSYDPETGPSRPGFRPESIHVLEWTDSGLPHLHVVYFGVGWLTTHDALSGYWSGKQGSVVYLRRLSKRGGMWLWSGGDADGEATREDGEDGPRDDGEDAEDVPDRRPRAYLSKALGTLSTVADMTPGEVEDRAVRTREGEGGDVWKASLYWATGKQVWGGSPGLKDDRDDGEGEGAGGDLPHVPCYRFVGAAKYGHIPGFVRRNGRVLGRGQGRGPPRPPPDATDPPSTGTPAD